MSQSINTPIIQVEHLKTKFDTVVVSNSLIALLDYNYNEARFLQQLHYWSYSQYGVIIDGIRWIYKSAKEWLSEALVGLTEWKLRKAISSLLEKDLIRREKLFARHQQQEYKSFWWQPKNQTYYYSINYEELEKLINKAETVETLRFESFTNLSIEETKTTKSCELSRNTTKNTYQRKITNKQLTLQNENTVRPISAAAESKLASEEKDGLNEAEATANSIASPVENKQHKPINRASKKESKSFTKVDQLINKNWKSQLKDLDDAGISVNQILIRLIKSYTNQEVENAIALVKTRKRERYIPNPAGYFVSALKENWAGEESINSDSDNGDLASVFRYWYDLAKQLGYCSGQEIREGEQWICLSGDWEKWSSAVKRGYSLDYLKKILKRNGGRS